MIVTCFVLLSLFHVGDFDQIFTNKCHHFGNHGYCSHYEDMIKTITSPKYAKLVGWLVAARHSSGLSIRELADKLDISSTAVHRIESLERRLDVFEYVLYCQALNVDPAAGLKLLR